jgi:branched-chain amino acid transport system substrate-binding protein
MSPNDTLEENDRSSNANRRRFLKVAGSAGAVGLAGCSGNSGDGGDGGDSDGGDSDGGDGGSGDNTVKIGVIYPLTGNLGEVGQNIQAFLEPAVEQIINGTDSGLDNLLLSGEEGLPNLNNREVELIFADHRADPGQGRSEAERLIQSEGVHAIYGCYNSSVTKTVSAVCEREGIPMLTGESSSPSLTERGLNWFWRSGPHDQTFTENMFQFFDGFNERQDGTPIESVAIIHEDTEYGSTSAEVQENLAEEHGYDIVAGPISYTAESVTSFTSQLQRIQQADPDVLLPTSYVSDAILMTEDMRSLDYMPPMVMAQDSGHSESSFVSQTELSNYFCSRSTFADDLTESVPEVGNYADWMQDVSDVSMNGVYIRSFGGLITLLAGINNGGSTNPEDIRSGLNNMEVEQLKTGLPFGIEFADNGQNSLATGVLNQYHDGEAMMVWPFNLAQDDTLEFPAPQWGDR